MANNHFKYPQHSVILIGLILLTVACDGSKTTISKTASDWPIFRGDAALSGYTSVRLPDNPALLWTYKSDSRTASSPVVKNGVVYWCDKRGKIWGVDGNGQLCFEYDLQTAVEATPMIADSMIYIGRIDGMMTAISLAGKDTVWNYETMGQISASPNIADFEGRQAAVFGSYDNFLYCVDAHSGKEISRFESGYYINGAVALSDGYIVFGGCDSYLRIIDCRTGIQTDSLLLDAYVPSSPAIRGKYCYAGDYSGNIYELTLEEGKIVRHRKLVTASKEDGAFVSVPAVSGEAVYFFSDARHLCSVDRKDGTQNWKYMLKGAVGESSPVVCRNKIVVCTKTGIITILDAATGALEWEYDAGEQITASPAVIQGRFLILTAKGTLLCFGILPH